MQTNDQELEAILEDFFSFKQTGYGIEQLPEALAAIQAHYNRKFEEALGKPEEVDDDFATWFAARNTLREEAHAKWYGEEKPNA